MKLIQYINAGGGCYTSYVNFFAENGFEEFEDAYAKNEAADFGEYEFLAEGPSMDFDTYKTVICAVRDVETGKVFLVNKVSVKGLDNDIPTNKRGERLADVSIDEAKQVIVTILPVEEMPFDTEFHPATVGLVFDESYVGITQNDIDDAIRAAAIDEYVVEIETTDTVEPAVEAVEAVEQVVEKTSLFAKIIAAIASIFRK